MKVIQQNILDIESGIICHQVNCLGVMGAGLALAIKNRHPEAYRDYSNLCNSISNQRYLLGTCQLVAVTGDLLVANLFNQYEVGTDQQQTNYGALGEALIDLDEQVKEYHPHSQIYIPYRMGCGLGGGNWESVLSIIEEIIPDAIICDLKGESL